MISVFTTPSLKLGLRTSEYQSIDWRNYDKVLVYEPYYQRQIFLEQWEDEVVAQDEGVWWLVAIQPDSNALPMQTKRQTLAQWAVDPEWGDLLMDGSITSIQLGLGNGNPRTHAIVTDLTASYVPNVNRASITVDFRNESATRGTGWQNGIQRFTGLAEFVADAGDRSGLAMSIEGPDDFIEFSRHGNFGKINQFEGSYRWMVTEAAVTVSA